MFKRVLSQFFYAIDLLYIQRLAIKIIVLRDLKSEFTHTYIGPLWFILQPLIQSIIFYYVFGKVGNMPIEGQNAFFFYIFGILVWTSFSQISLNNSWTLINNKGVVTKIKTSPYLFPLSNSLFRLIQCAINLFIFFLVYSVAIKFNFPDYDLRLLPSIIFGLIICASMGMLTGIFAASLSTSRRDIIHLWGYILNGLLYLSPIIYPVSATTGKFYILSTFNPLTLGIESIRSPIISNKYLPYIFYQNGLAVLLLIFIVASFMYIKKYYEGLDEL
jgi:lipopolysaccharide transport system permease protein